MIMLTRLNGQAFALNCDLVERIDITPDTVITLLDGTKYLVLETAQDIINQVREFRASIVAHSHHLDTQTASTPSLRVVTDLNDEG
ncbi:MAG: flagellar FlbD family protein [Acidimicrobiales bacterium]